VIDADGTDVGAALRLADATFIGAGTEGGRRVVVISDGNTTSGDALLEARNLAVSGAVVDVLTIDYDHAEEVLVDGVRYAVVRPRQSYDIMLGEDCLPPWLDEATIRDKESAT